jgi:hypothetical protein
MYPVLLSGYSRKYCPNNPEYAPGMHKAEIAVYMSTISAFLSLSGEGEYYAEKLIFDVY